MTMVAMGVAAIAQTSAGTLMLGGNLGFNSFNGGENSATVGATTTTVEKKAFTNWSVSPAIGYFIMNDLAVGLRLSLGGITRGQAVSTDGRNRENFNSFDLGVELFGRYYMNLSDKLYLFGDLGVGYMSSSWTRRVASTTNPAGFNDGNAVKQTGLGVNIAPGLAYFPSEKWGIDLTLNRIVSFMSMTETEEAPNNAGKTEDKSTDFGIGLGLNPSLGLHYYFGK